MKEIQQQFVWRKMKRYVSNDLNLTQHLKRKKISLRYDSVDVNVNISVHMQYSTAKEVRLSCSIVVLKYVLRRRRAENDLSVVAVLAGMV